MTSYKIMGAGAVLAVLGCGVIGWWPSAPAPAAGPSAVSSPTAATPAAGANRSGPQAGAAATASSIQGAVAGERLIADPGRHFKQAVTKGGVEINDAIETLLPAWAAREPREALDYAESLPDEALRESVLHRIIQTWGANDAREALDWISKRANAAERHSFSIAVCQQIAKTDAKSAIAVAENTGVARDNPDFIPYLVGMWAGKDSSGALAWVRSQPDDTLRHQSVASVILSIAQNGKYESAVKLAFDELPAGARQDDALITIVNQWAQKDLESASVWVESFSIANPLRGRAFAEVEGARRVQKTSPAGG